MIDSTDTTGCSLRELCSLCNVSQSTLLPCRAMGLLIQRWPVPNSAQSVWQNLCCFSMTCKQSRLLFFHNSLKKYLYPWQISGGSSVLNWANRRSLKGLFGISSSWIRPRPCAQSHIEMIKGKLHGHEMPAEVSHLQEKWVAEQVDWHNSEVPLAEHFSWGVLNAGGTPSCFLQKVNHSWFRHCCCPLCCIEEHYSDIEMCYSYGTGDQLIRRPLFPELPTASQPARSLQHSHPT